MDSEAIDKEHTQREQGEPIETITGEIISQPDHAPRQPWDRLPNESPYWYDAFLLYRNLPSHNRSIIAAYRQHKLAQNVILPPGAQASPTWYHQSHAMNWDKRTALYYDHVTREAQARAEQAVQDWYVKSRFDLSNMWDDLQVEWNMIEPGNMSRSQVIAATKTIGQQLTPQSNQSIDVQIILNKLPADIQTALLRSLATR